MKQEFNFASLIKVVEDESPPSSANTTYMASGNSTKTVVSMMDQTDTLKAAELVSKLQILADQISGGGGAQAAAVSYPDVVEDSICSNTSKLEESIRETLEHAADINLSTISKVLAEASISSDPHQFVNVILGCLKNKVQAEKKNEDHEESQVHDVSNVLSSSSRESKKTSFNATESGSAHMVEASATPKTSATLPRTGRSSATPTGRLSHTPSSKMTSTESKRAMMRLTPGSSGLELIMGFSGISLFLRCQQHT